MPKANTPLKRSAKTTKAEDKLAKSVRELSKEIRKLKNQDFLKVFSHPWKFMWYSFLKGLMVGFGSILGASFLVGFFLYILAQISFVPILGDFVEDVMSQIQIENGQDNKGTPDIFDQYNDSVEEIK